MTRTLLAALALLAGANLANAYPVTDDEVVKNAVRHGAHITLHGVFDAK